MFERNLVFGEKLFENAEEAIRFGAEKLFFAGYVTEGYADSVVKREKEFPTGLPTVPFGIAIPHTDSAFVKKSGICCMRLKKPLPFRQMGDGEAVIEVYFVLLLAISDGAEHVDLLSGLMELFSSEDTLEQLRRATDEEGIIEILERTKSGLPL